MNHDINAKLKLLIKSEKALLKLEMRKKGRQTILISIALLAILVGLVMLNVTFYLYLETQFTPLISAAILSGVNLLLAVIFFVIASRQSSGPEAESIEEIRNFALDQLSTDIDGVKKNVSEFKESAYRVKSSVDSLTSGEFFGLKGVVPIISTLLDMKKKK